MRIRQETGNILWNTARMDMKTYDVTKRVREWGKMALACTSVILLVITAAAALRGIFIMGAWLYGDAGGVTMALLALISGLIIGFTGDK